MSRNSARSNRSFAVDRKARYELIFILMPECERYSLSKGALTRCLILIRSPLEKTPPQEARSLPGDRLAKHPNLQRENG